jgi:hypothetical protein
MVTKIEIKRRIVGCPRSALLVPIIAPRCAHFMERKIGQVAQRTKVVSSTKETMRKERAKDYE